MTDDLGPGPQSAKTPDDREVTPIRPRRLQANDLKHNLPRQEQASGPAENTGSAGLPQETGQPAKTSIADALAGGKVIAAKNVVQKKVPMYVPPPAHFTIKWGLIAVPVAAVCIVFLAVRMYVVSQIHDETINAAIEQVSIAREHDVPSSVPRTVDQTPALMTVVQSDMRQANPDQPKPKTLAGIVAELPSIRGAKISDKEAKIDSGELKNFSADDAVNLPSDVHSLMKQQNVTSPVTPDGMLKMPTKEFAAKLQGDLDKRLSAVSDPDATDSEIAPKSMLTNEDDSMKRLSDEQSAVPGASSPSTTMPPATIRQQFPVIAANVPAITPKTVKSPIRAALPTRVRQQSGSNVHAIMGGEGKVVPRQPKSQASTPQVHRHHVKGNHIRHASRRR